MSERIQKLIKPMIFLAATVFVVCCILKKPVEIGDYTSYIGYAVTIDTFFFVAYEKWLWKIIPWNRPPILKENYDGLICYKFNGIAGKKPIEITIKQSWLNVDVKTKTDINSSVTITATIVNEHNQDILYYTYMTCPSAAVEKNNPVQHGTCRMILDGDNSKISGKYWTSSNTTGDMMWTEKR